MCLDIPMSCGGYAARQCDSRAITTDIFSYSAESFLQFPPAEIRRSDSRLYLMNSLTDQCLWKVTSGGMWAYAWRIITG